MHTVGLSYVEFWKTKHTKPNMMKLIRIGNPAEMVLGPENKANGSYETENSREWFQCHGKLKRMDIMQGITKENGSNETGK